MGLLVRVLTLIRAANQRFAIGFGQVLSWPLWLPAILAGSFLGMALHQEDLVMLLLTIQTSVDSAATKMLQNHVRADDEKRDKRNDAILLELQRQARAAAKRDSVILASFRANNDLMKLLLEGGILHGQRSKSNSRSNRRRT